MLKTVMRALRLLELLSAQQKPLSLTEVAHHLQLNPSTAHRLLSTLKVRGYVEQDADSTYRLGMRLFAVGAGAPTVVDLRDVTVPVMRRLAARSGETASLVVRDHGDGVCLDQVPSPKLVAVKGLVGERFPLHCTATGKILLAHLSPDGVTRIVADLGLPRFTQRTITDAIRLQRELDHVRRIGIAYDRGERTTDVMCAAAAVVNHLGEVTAAISLSGPAHRLSEIRLRRLGRMVRAGCEEISRRLGWGERVIQGRRARAGTDANG